MKLFLRTQGVCRNASKSFFNSSSTKLPSHTSSSSSVITERKKESSSRISPTFPPNSSLYKRISPVGDPDVSIIPVLDQWVREGRKVDKDTLDYSIKSLKKYRRFKHALEISEWMTDKRYIPPTKGDITCRLDLIYRVRGLEKAEEFYNNISQIFKGHKVDFALLNIYSLEKSVDKAEAVMQKLRETGRLKTTFPYNILLNLYCNVGNWEKMDSLTNEMERNGIYRDRYSFTARLNAYAATSDIEGLTTTMAKMEADPHVGMDCNTYLVAAKAFSRVGLVEKCSELLKTFENTVIATKGKHNTLSAVLRMYAKLGKKDEVNRIWKILETENVYNSGYRNMIQSLLRFDDVEGAERIFEQWETKGLSYDFQIPNELIDVYVKKGKLDKAEDLLKRGVSKGGDPTFRTWYCLATGYVEDNRVGEGVEALKNATVCCQTSASEGPVKDKLAILSKYLETRGNREEVEGYMNLLKADGIFSSTVCRRLVDFITNETSEA